MQTNPVLALDLGVVVKCTKPHLPQQKRGGMEAIEA